MPPTVSVPALPGDAQFVGFANSDSEPLRFRPATGPDELLIAGAARLLERVDLPRRLRNNLHTFRAQSRRAAINRSAFALLLEATEYAEAPADALWFARLIEAELLGRKAFPVPASSVAHIDESHANAELDLAQIAHRERRTPATLDELLEKALVQELSSRVLAASEASEMRVRHVLMSR